jgi:hypothetical protein
VRGLRGVTFAGTLLRTVASRGRWKEVAMVNSITAGLSEFQARSFMLGFAGLLFVTVIGFVSVTQALISTSADYGYDEALGTQTSSLSSLSFSSNCSDDGPTIAGASSDGSEKLQASAIVAPGARSSADNLHARATEGNHVE